jgi:plasmid stability protein
VQILDRRSLKGSSQSAFDGRTRHVINDIMAQLLVRNLDEELVRALQVRAAEHGRSTEAEHREILKEALTKTAPRVSFKAFLESMPNVGEDADFERDPGIPGDDLRDVDL